MGRDPFILYVITLASCGVPSLLDYYYDNLTNNKQTTWMERTF